MSNEKRSDSWIDELDGLAGLPGEAPFDRTVVWDRLHQRLNEKKGKKRGIWYWAAACLFLAVIVLVLLKQEQKVHVQSPVLDVKETPVIVKHPAVPIPVTEPGDTPVIKKPALVKIKKSTAIADVTVILPPVIKIIPHTDTVQAETAVAAAAPRKIRVVHINEVGGDVIGNAYVYPEHKQFKIGISGPAGFASQVIADKTSKTILPPKN